MTFKSFIVVTALLVLLSFSISASESPDNFSVELQYLKQQNAAKIGVPSLIGAYEKFIARYQSDARVASAMFDLGVIYESQWKGQDHNKALEYFGVAAKAATPNTEIWKKANFYFFNRVLDKDFRQAKKVLDNMKSHLKDGDLILSMAIEQKYLDFYGVQGNLDESEKYLCNLLSIYRDPQRLPKNDIEKSEVDNILITSSGNMVAYISNAVNLTPSEKLLRLQNIGTKYPLFTQFRRYRPVMEELKARLNSDVMSIASEQIQMTDSGHAKNNSATQSANNNVSGRESGNRIGAVIKGSDAANVPEGKTFRSSLYRGMFILIVCVLIIMSAWLIKRRMGKA